jgi:hypothetical protein
MMRAKMLPKRWARRRFTSIGDSTAKRDNKFSSSDVNCHVTLP